MCNVSTQRLAKIWLKLHKSQTDRKGILKTCTVMQKRKELNNNIGSKCLHHFVQRLLVPSVRQQVAKTQVLMRSQQNCSKQDERQYWTALHRICVTIWETGEWPEEWTLSTFIPLSKKGDLKQCTNYRTIALVSQASKIFLRIILEKIPWKTETEIAYYNHTMRKSLYHHHRNSLRILPKRSAACTPY